MSKTKDKVIDDQNAMSEQLSPCDYTYCKGEDCAKRDQCWRYVQGKKLPAGNWWWMMNCQNHREMIKIEK